MNSKHWIRYALTMCMLVTVFATYSMVALAYDGKAAGEILVTGNDEASSVTVNGEAVKSGRSIFSSSTITTPETAGAILNLGKTGRIELARNTTFSLSFSDSSVSGDLTSGSVTVLDTVNPVSVRTAAGNMTLKAGETATANATAPGKAPAAGASSGDWGWWALIVGGAVGVIIYTAASGGDNRFGSGAVEISPSR